MDLALKQEAPVAEQKLVTISGKQEAAQIARARAPRANSQESFQIVWTQLAFEVDKSAYDKVLNRTLSFLRTISGTGNEGGYLQQVRLAKQFSDSGRQTTTTTTTTRSEIEAGISAESIISNSGKSDRLSVSGKRTIFDNLNGYLNSGELTAILGPSGAGKTSLLNAICGRTCGYRGQMRLVGAVGRRRMRLSIIPQKDYLIENLTVKENLLFSSRILNPDGDFDHEANIGRVVRMLNLGSCYQSRAANISGGEYKRVSIAQELLRQPDILVLDEPTSGLDSLNCKKLISSLVQLRNASRVSAEMKPIAIVMTIHQPDVEVFHMFDHIYCMARNGRVVFDGQPRDALKTIETHAKSVLAANDGQSYVSINPANLLIEIASEDLYGAAPIDKLARVQRKQFEQMYSGVNSEINGGGGGGGGDRGEQLSQLQANLLTAAGATYANEKEKNLDEQQEQQQQMVVVTMPNIIMDNLKGHVEQTEPAQDERGLKQAASTSTLDDENVAAAAAAGSNSSSASSSSSLSNGRLVRDKRLIAKNDHSGRFWYYTSVLAQRSFKSTLRDPLMTLIVMIFHLTIPFVMWTVYPRHIGTTHSCPVIQHELDIVSMAGNATVARLEKAQEEIITTIECSAMFFLTTYSFSMCAITVAALVFPLDMHILLKEVRNGWYNLPSYVLAKTLANIPFEVLFPVVSLAMIYLLLDMPASPYHWRLIGMALVMGLISMISHTQGLIFGALCMDSVQTAIFLASASTLPQTLLSGFTARIHFMPLILQRLSWLSQYRYSSDIINLIRYGFGICPCDATTNEYLQDHKPEFKDMPENLKPIFIFYLMNDTPNPYEATTNLTTTTTTNATFAGNGGGANYLTNGTLLLSNVTSSLMPETPPKIPGVDYEIMLNATERYSLLKQMEANEVDLFGRMAELLARALSFGRKLEGCPSVRSQVLVTGNSPPDDYLPVLFVAMFALFLACKLILFLTVRHKISSRL